MTSILLLKSMLFANALQKSKKKKKNKRKNIHKIKKGNFSMCRVCNEEQGNIPIFDNMVIPDLPGEITHFSGVTVSKTDNLSTSMCQNCLDLLNGCIMFRDICQSTNEKLIQLSKQKVTDITTKTKNYKSDSSTENRIVVWAEPADDLPKKENSHASGEELRPLNPIDPSRPITPEPLDAPPAVSDDDYNIPSPEFSEDGHTDQSIWACIGCHQGFNDLAAYNYHQKICKLQTVEGPKRPEEKQKFLCDVCGKTTTAHASLLTHIGTHVNSFPFKCDVCPYQGRSLDLLKVHKRSHMAVKPYKCTQCPKATTTASNLTKHMRHVHSTARPFKCSYCDKAFSLQHEMKKHIREIHLRQSTVECDICYKNFNTKKILQGHRFKVHKIKGVRKGRLPSYLQYQIEEQVQDNENIETITDNVNECETKMDRCQDYDNDEKL